MRDRNDPPEEDPPRVSKSQRALAENLAHDLREEMRFEKRNINEDFQTAFVDHPRLGEPVSVRMTRHPFEDRDYYIVLSTRELPEVRNAGITVNRLGEQVHLEGRIERLRPGDRAEDQTERGQVVLYHFYEFFPGGTR